MNILLFATEQTLVALLQLQLAVEPRILLDSTNQLLDLAACGQRGPEALVVLEEIPSSPTERNGSDQASEDDEAREVESREESFHPCTPCFA